MQGCFNLKIAVEEMKLGAKRDAAPAWLEVAPTPMNNSSSALESAETRVAASKAGIVAQVHALNFRVRRLVKSPYVIAGLVISAAAAGYFAVTRSVKLRAPSSLPAARGSLTSLLKTAQMLLPLLGALGAAAKAPKRYSRAFPVVIRQPGGSAQGSAAAAPRGNWLSQQLQMIKAAVKAWVDDYAPSMGAALSYYTLFSLAPLLIIVIAVAGMVFGQEAAQGEIVAQLRGIMGEEGAVAVEGMLKAAREPAKGVVATIVGIAMLLLGATVIFAELQSALDRIWRVPAAKEVSGIWHLLRTRLLSFGLVLGLGFLLVVSLVVSAVLAALGKWWGGWFDDWDVFLEILNFAVSFGIFTLLFAMIYKIMPRANIPWRDVWTGAAVTALLFTIGKVLIGLYLGKSSLASGFGAAGSLVVLIAWVYYAAQIFLFGAEYTWVYANRHGSRMQKPVLGDASAVPGRSSD
jgi:YihY family inner membrane protein